MAEGGGSSDEVETDFLWGTDLTEREYEYSTDDVEIETDGLVNDVRAELPPEMAVHVAQRERCRCRRYKTDRTAHPDSADGRGKYCRLHPLKGKEWADSVCSERETWRTVKKIFKTSKNDDITIRDLRADLDWHRDQLEHLEASTRDTIEQAYLNNGVLIECVERMSEAIKTFVESPKPYSADATNRMIFITNKAVLRMKTLEKPDEDGYYGTAKGAEGVEGSECGDWNGSWEVTDDDNDGDDDCHWGKRNIRVSEKHDEQNRSGNDLAEQGADAKVEPGAGENKDKNENDNAGDPPPLIETPKAGTGADKVVNAGAGHEVKNDSGNKRQETDRHVVIDENGDRRHTGLNNLPSKGTLIKYLPVEREDIETCGFLH